MCIDELHRLSAVKEYFNVELKKGFWARFSKDERRRITVLHLSRKSRCLRCHANGGFCKQRAVRKQLAMC